MSAPSAPSAPERLLRSVLYVPASNARALEKARGLACDAVILDLEDAVAPEDKPRARRAAVEALGAGFRAPVRVLRVNALGEAEADADLEAALEARPDAVLAPKVSRASEAEAWGRRLTAERSGPKLWIMVETARAVLDLSEIAGADAPLEALVLGPNDLALETGVRLGAGRAPLHAVMTGLVVAARAHGLAALDGPWGVLDDLEGLAAECREARDFGFDGKTLIHPGHIAAAERAFRPEAEELARARAVVAAFASPEAAGKGALRVEGRMVERLHLRQAERLLARDAAARRADGSG